MRILGYFLFSILLLAALSLIFDEVSGDGFGMVYYAVILFCVVISLAIGRKIKFPVADILAVNSFSMFYLIFSLVKYYDGIGSSLISVLMVSCVIVSSVYLFLRIIGWIGPKPGFR